MDRRTFLTSTVLTGTALAALPTGLANASPTLTRARAVRATTLDGLRQAIAAAKPGDTVILANGTYAVPSGRPIAIQGKHGSDGASIIVQAESVGGVTLTGSQGFTFADSSWVTVSGFKFRQSTMIDLTTSCNHLRISRNDFQLANTEGLNWLMVRAEYSKVDHNHFHNKSSLGVFLCVEGPGSAGMSRGVHIVRNYFSDHTFGGSNGGEPIRLGLSGRSLSDAGAIVEQNLFERANGDPEAISVKSCSNTIRDNTVRNSLGGIVLRHGSRSRVEGNFILNGTNGIRMYGNDHLVVNNYVEKVTGAGIVLGSGSVRDDKPSDSPESRKGNDAPDRVTIALNTVLSCGTAIAGETMRTLPPLGCTISDNLLVGDSGRQLVDMPFQQGITWSGNLLWGAAGNGNIPASGFTRKDPLLATGSDGVRRLTSGSPGINAASKTYSTVTRDLDGNTRSGKADVGADEYSTTAPVNRPLTPGDVGPQSA
ncbi:polysaccharide lyase 6 family protein [Streptomyces sp. SID13031]|uniref:polysaccharide lyase 6 family protein n=1 Tax=Streptomyces sp. SID13031 TaxID=2706046 RepID=UPI0013C847CA|nr:polysaccharide lyase 6 family protein [Streptomyces sp. SID13031]NEA37325.1 lyase precursor [Streptomyces sp. SID13031]